MRDYTYIKYIIICVLSCCFTVGRAQTAINELEILVEPEKFAPLPKADNAYWRDSIPEVMRNSYIKYGEQYLNKQWTVLPLTMFAENKINGNRTRYEAACFEKRRMLAALVMAEIVEGKGRFMPDIINGLGSMCEETWWGIPAHTGRMFPVAEDQNVDLFNAETAGLVAWTRCMLESKLEAFAPGFCSHIDKEITRRLLIPAVTTDYWWKKAGMNWNPWICSNWLTCVLICESDRGRYAEAISQITSAMEAFIAAYPDDGGCDEGTGYWDRAAASLYECMRLMRGATSSDSRLSSMTSISSLSSSSSLKIKRMLEYIYKMYIGNDYCVNFADAHDNRMQAQPDIILPMAIDMDDSVMKGFAAYLAKSGGVFDNPAKAYRASGNFPALGRELFMLRDISKAMAINAVEPLIKDVWLPDLQIMTARRGNLYVAVKGGNNGESHNHNDVGSFIMYADGEPLLIDTGAGEYTAATFGKDRYTIWTMQSAYHNLPIINGVQQKDGKEYAAKLINRNNGRLTLDIAPAYPAEAAVRSWLRTVSITGKAIEITEDYHLTAYKAPTQLVLMTTTLPDITRKGRIILGSHTIEYDANIMEPAVEDVSDKQDALLRRIWGKHMYRIVLTIRQDGVNGKIKYKIR